MRAAIARSVAAGIRGAAVLSTPLAEVVDWVQLLEQLRELGVRTSTVSELTGISRQALGEYRQGIKTPLHARGEALIRAWCELTGLARAHVPMCVPLPTVHGMR